MTGRHGDLRDLEHVVILMQENRSFDHYFGSLRGFAGAQPPSPLAGAQNFGGTDHSWTTQHQAWNGGRMNGWQHAKGGPVTLGYLNRQDIPYYYALADAYTIGDAYFCSALSATGPNRTYLWSGTINAGTTEQEAGPKRARPLPYQPNANLDGFTAGGGMVQACLSFSNDGPQAGRPAISRCTTTG